MLKQQQRSPGVAQFSSFFCLKKLFGIEFDKCLAPVEAVVVELCPSQSERWASVISTNDSVSAPVSAPDERTQSLPYSLSVLTLRPPS